MKTILSAILFFIFSSTALATSGRQEIFDNLPKEQSFGAEIQYFRLRGGIERNIPRSQVLELWGKALDAAKAAQMNTVSFYIPWDFHEYAEGKFDFDGSVDEDGDGQPDYPSRDVKTFLQMIKERGFSTVMARPGPYINAEWGFLGFGAIPEWFHKKYPDSHMQNARGQRMKLYDYHSPDLHAHTKTWFKAVYDHVLKNELAPTGIIKFLQIDNETNFMWQSIHNLDFGPRATARYQEFLKNRYGSLAAVNLAHQRSWAKWQDIKGPAVYGQNIPEDQDWYRFQDESIYTYLKILRSYWEDLGLREPQVIFTLAESYNAMGQGLLPNHRFRNDHATGLLTVNLYPKTEETPAKPFLNQPFKSDHDVKAQETASEFYLGSGNRWVMGPEIQGGWWKGIPVTPQARQQTYLSVIGHGMKSMIVYYFNEGQNWQASWQRDQVKPYFEQLRLSPQFAGIQVDSLPENFWQELQQMVDRNVIVGIDARREMQHDPKEADELFFDAPLDGNANPRGHYSDLKRLGERLYAPHGPWLRQSVTNYDPVCLLKDSRAAVPSLIQGIDSVRLNADWEAGLVGYALNAGYNLRIVHWGMSTDADLKSCKVILHHDNGQVATDLSRKVNELVSDGKTVVNFFADSLAQKIGIAVPSKNVSSRGASLPLNFNKKQTIEVPSEPLFQYSAVGAHGCSSVLKNKTSTHAYRCDLSNGGVFIQVGALISDVFNSNAYATVADVPARTAFFQSMIAHSKIKPVVHVTGSEKVVAFSRGHATGPETWITVKSGQAQPTKFSVRVQSVDPALTYVVRDLLGTAELTMGGDALMKTGFPGQLEAIGSTVYWIEPAK